jgi:hypothetical protein
MMMLADVCMFAVVLSLLGEIKLAVTTRRQGQHHQAR